MTASAGAAGVNARRRLHRQVRGLLVSEDTINVSFELCASGGP
jgi:hypothetical protein